MSIDATIPLGVRPPQFEGPLDLAAKYQQMQSGQMQNRLIQRHLQSLDMAEQKQNALQGILKNSVDPTTGKFDQAKASTALLQGGHFEEAQALQKQSLEQQQQQRLMATAKIEDALKKMAFIGQNLQGATTEPEYQARVQHIEQTLGPQENLHIPWHPGLVDEFMQQARPIATKLQEHLDQFNSISTTGGLAAFNKATGKYEIQRDESGQPFMAPNASPELAQQMQLGKERVKGVEVTGPQGEKFRTTQQEANPAAFANPGNMRPSGASTGFQSFDTPEAGISAIDKNLQAYGEKGINTLAGVINRWSPSSENDTASLVANASKRLGIKPDQPIDLSNPLARHAISTAIMLQEHGPQGIFQSGPIKGPTQAQAETNKIQTAAKIDLPKTIDAADYSIKLLDELKAHPGLKTAVGAPSMLHLSAIAGTNAADFQTRLDQLQGQQFLNAYNTLKGGGQITEVEGKKATDAMARLQTKQSPDEFKKSIDELKGILEKGKMRAQQKAGIKVEEPKQPVIKGAQFLGFE